MKTSWVQNLTLPLKLETSMSFMLKLQPGLAHKTQSIKIPSLQSHSARLNYGVNSALTGNRGLVHFLFEISGDAFDKILVCPSSSHFSLNQWALPGSSSVNIEHIPRHTHPY